jgi:hypothetical protein
LAVLGRRAGDPFDEIQYSSDDGVTWRTISRSGFRFGNAQAVAVDPWRAGTVWISTSGRSVARFTPWTELENWRNVHFGSPDDAGPGGNAADGDHDGLTNLVEYALGTPPTVGTAGVLTAFAAKAAGHDYPAIRIERAGRRSGIGYQVEVSRDLVVWESGPAVTEVLTDTDVLLEVRHLQPIAEESRCFLGLRVVAGE